MFSLLNKVYSPGFLLVPFSEQETKKQRKMTTASETTICLRKEVLHREYLSIFILK